jgi:hypothetical protein
MTTDELIQDLRAHAHEAPAQCAALMRRAAAELQRHDNLVAVMRLPSSAPAAKERAPCG